MAPKPLVCIRTARREDIPQIEACNLKTLPENYPNAFYHNHLLQWPYLALVAERRPEGEGQQGQQSQQPQQGAGSEKRCIVGYVLGRVAGPGGYGEEGQQDRLPGFEAVEAEASQQPQHAGGPKTGHVSSLAVLDEYRRQGVAKELMDILHVQMQFRYGVGCSTLHVRCSNRGAQRLYVDTLGYKIVQTVPRYYQDGADAYYMRLDFTPSVALPLEGSSSSIPAGGMRLKEKEGALLTQDSAGYLQLYPRATGGSSSPANGAAAAAAAGMGGGAASARPTA